MIKYLFIAIAILMPTIHANAQDNNNTLFQYPSAPDDLTTMEERCSYVVEHFWDRCNINQALSTRNKLQQAFKDYIQLIPYANATTVHQSVDKLIDRIKKNPKQLLTFAEMAESTMYSDSALIVCDEVYYPFAKAVADSKKIKPAEKVRFEKQARILSGSQVNMVAPDFNFIDTDGKTHRLSELMGTYVILLFDDPNCSDCMLARVRLSADYNIKQFIKKGQLKIVSIFPGDPDDNKWKEIATRLPEDWIVGASPEVESIYDMRIPPVIYYLNNKQVILSKSMTADQLINAFREINTRNSN